MNTLLPCVVLRLPTVAALLLALTAITPKALAQAPAPQPAPAPDAAAAPQDDIAKKAEILRSPRWRRAVFELGDWLDTQEIYPPKQVQKIKSDFNHRVAKMSSYELEYLLEDLEQKF
jgi:hypothetical protein